MIARVWHGWTTDANADAYQHHFQSQVLGHLKPIVGFRGAQLWRRDQAGQAGGVEFVAVTTFESFESVRRFAGSDYERAIVAPEARRVLNHFDERCKHYQVAVAMARGQP